MGVIFITHDMGVVADIADRVLVMYQGEAVETGSVEQIFHAPQHPYTKALLAAVPQLGAMSGHELSRRFPLISLQDSDHREPQTEQDTVVAGEPILQVRNLVTRFPLRSGILNRVTREVHAVGEAPPCLLVVFDREHPLEPGLLADLVDSREQPEEP